MRLTGLNSQLTNLAKPGAIGMETNYQMHKLCGHFSNWADVYPSFEHMNYEFGFWFFSFV